MSKSNYALRMARLSARIFGEVARPTNESSMRVVNMFSRKPLSADKFIVDYYPNHPQYTNIVIKARTLGLFRDEHRDFKEEIMRLKVLRGKGKPKKGEGKRAVKKK